MEHQKLKLIGMDCPSCIKSIEDSLKRLPGVKTARVDFVTSEVMFSYDKKEITLQIFKNF